MSDVMTSIIEKKFQVHWSAKQNVCNSISIFISCHQQRRMIELQNFKIYLDLTKYVIIEKEIKNRRKSRFFIKMHNNYLSFFWSFDERQNILDSDFYCFRCRSFVEVLFMFFFCFMVWSDKRRREIFICEGHSKIQEKSFNSQDIIY